MVWSLSQSRASTSRWRRSFRYWMAAVFLAWVACSGTAAFAQAYENTAQKTVLIEKLVYADLQSYKDTIDYYCRIFRVNPVTVYAILYVEKMQYELDIFRRTKKEIERRLSTYGLFSANLAKWAQLSVGYSHIKPLFARETKIRLDRLEQYREFITRSEINPGYYMRKPETAIKITVAAIFLFQHQWRSDPNGIDISGRPGILATLFCLGYQKSHPHANPKPGGSYLPVIIDGELIENRSFGEKVALISFGSAAMRRFVRQFMD